MFVFASFLTASLLMAAPVSQAPVSDRSTADALSKQLAGIYTNEEQVYFAKNAGDDAPPWLSLHIRQTKDGLVLSQTDLFSKPIKDDQAVSVEPGGDHTVLTVGNCARFFERNDDGWTYGAIQNRKLCRQDFQIVKIADEGLTLRLNDGSETTLTRARPVACWAAIPKEKKKADGSTDWHFAPKLTLHDQGGRVLAGGGDSGAEAVILRMRAVHWPPPSRNRPSMVLYIHKPDNPDSAVSYSWADIDASRIGINLRWMQASCTIQGAERGSEITAETFPG